MIWVLFKYSLGISCSREWRYAIPLATSTANLMPWTWSTMMPEKEKETIVVINQSYKGMKNDYSCCKRMQSSESRFFLSKKYELLLRSLCSNTVSIFTTKILNNNTEKQWHVSDYGRRHGRPPSPFLTLSFSFRICSPIPASVLIMPHFQPHMRDQALMLPDAQGWSGEIFNPFKKYILPTLR